MGHLLMLVKVLTCFYHAKKLKDRGLLNELTDVLGTLKTPNTDVFVQDRKIDSAIRSTIDWILEQPDDEAIIKSMLMQRVYSFVKEAPELKDLMEVGLEDYPTTERTRQIIYKHIDEIKKEQESAKINDALKKKIKDFHFKELRQFQKNDWVEFMDVIQGKINQAYNEEKQSEVVDSVSSDDKDPFIEIIERAQREQNGDGIIKLGIQGINRGLGPDQGLRRGKTYLWNALTNRGKSLMMGHAIASTGLYNKATPMLRNKSKIPTIVLDSAEDGIELILNRMYKLICVAKTGKLRPFEEVTSEEIYKTITEAFIENGWYFIFNQIEPNKDNYANFCARIRKLEMRGHEIIMYVYDYLAMMELDGIVGDSKSDRLQILLRKARAFTSARGICFNTPHQLNPDAKRLLRESDDDSEIYFAQMVAGKSMTETSTKLTNEVDAEITIHVAKTSTGNYFTYAIGKIRGDAGDPAFSFGIYDLDPVLGLVHDIAGKPMCRKKITHRLNDFGDSVPGEDDFDIAA